MNKMNKVTIGTGLEGYAAIPTGRTFPGRAW